MAYNDGEKLLLKRIQALDLFAQNNSARNNWKLLYSGNSDHYAILRPGSFQLRWISITDYIVTYTTVVEVWQRYTDDGDSQSNLGACVADIFSILAYPNLGDSSQVLDSSIVDSSEPTEMHGDNMLWLRWEINVQWEDITSVTYQE